jgi:hypothetical protein
MLNALRAFVMLLILVGTAHAGETLSPPAPQQGPPPSGMSQEPSSGETPGAETAIFELSDCATNVVLELLAILPTLL